VPKEKHLYDLDMQEVGKALAQVMVDRYGLTGATEITLRSDVVNNEVMSMSISFVELKPK